MPQISHLRLVRPVMGDAHAQAQVVVRAAQASLRDVFLLASAQNVVRSVSASIVRDLLQGLLPGDCLEFIHEVRQPVAANTAVAAGLTAAERRYQFSVHGTATQPSADEPLAQRLATALLAGCPPMHFVHGCTALPHTRWEHNWHVTLAPLLLRPRPELARFSHLDELHADEHALPHWGDFPDWAFTALTEPLGLPAAVQVVLRAYPYRLAPGQGEQLARLRHRLQSGNLLPFNHRAPAAAYAADADAMNAASSLMTAWLTQPDQGTAYDCVIRASGPVPPVALRRLAADLFGKRETLIAALQGAEPALPAPLPFHWAARPGQECPAMFPALPKLQGLGLAQHFAPPQQQPPASGGAVVGRTVCGAESSSVALPDANRSRHMALFGASGSGKSSLLLRLLEQDIASPARPGVALLDPHGSLVHDLLHLIPRHRVDDVILVDVTDPERTACLNPLQGSKTHRGYAAFMADQVVALVDNLFEDRNTSGPAMRGHLRTALLLAGYAHKREGTFMDALRCWQDSDYGDYLASKCTDRSIKQQWEKLRESKGSDHGFSSWLPFLLPRLSPFATSPVMRRLFNRPDSSFSIPRAMAQGKILLFNLSKAVLGETEGRIAGNLVLNMLFAAALARGRQPGVAHRPMHLVVDEAQSYCTEQTVALFAEARKFGLAITSANQSLGQLRNRSGQPTIAQGVLANTAVKLMFRLNPADAELLQPYYQPQFETAAMSTLPDFHAVVSMPVNGQAIAPFVARFDRPLANQTVHAAPGAVLAVSDAKYTVPIAQANKDLVQHFDLDAHSLEDGPMDNLEDLFTTGAAG